MPYSGNPVTSSADELRFLIGDTDRAKPMLSDGEVAYLLFQSGDSPLLGAIQAIQQLLVRYRGYVDQSVGSVSVSWSQRTTNLQSILGMLQRRLATMGFAGPRAGGICVADKLANQQNPDVLQPQLTARQDHGRAASLGPVVTTDARQLTGRLNP